MVSFNYIITVHNREDLIEKVLTSILLCSGQNSHIYAVLDGCTDRSEAIIDELLKNKKNYVYDSIPEFDRKLKFSYTDLKWVDDDIGVSGHYGRRYP